jgi:hypothetical protein
LSEPSLLSLIVDRQDRLESELGETTTKANEIPVLRKEVAMLTKAVDRNTTALYSVVGSVVATGILGLLLQKGVIG